MKIAVIGAGNMGGAIAKSLVRNVDVENIIVSAPSDIHLHPLKEYDKRIKVTHDNCCAVSQSDIVILAVKPWFIEQVLREIQSYIAGGDKILISIAAGVSLGDICRMVPQIKGRVFRVMPNIAIEYAASVNVIATNSEDRGDIALVESVFAGSGAVYFTDEAHFDAFMSLTSCGIAFVLRFVRAMQEGAVELGIRPDQARGAIADTLCGAVALLRGSQEHAESLIDRVTTPGGITIRGLNALEHKGFTSAVVSALLATTSSD